MESCHSNALMYYKVTYMHASLSPAMRVLQQINQMDTTESSLDCKGTEQQNLYNNH